METVPRLGPRIGSTTDRGGL